MSTTSVALRPVEDKAMKVTHSGAAARSAGPRWSAAAGKPRPS